MRENLPTMLRTAAKEWRKENKVVATGATRYDAALDEAADAIEELKQQVEHYHGCMNDWFEAAQEYEAAVPKWIPVTERLPKEGEFVLVYGDLYPNKHDGGVIAVSKRMDWNYWQGFGRERDITHWMPLPQPPKEE